jgi:G3E family GTPase
MQPKKIITVPPNIITGFLAADKTSVILHLLKYKPKGDFGLF